MRVVIAGGGTGGHLFPAVAVAEELLRQRVESQVLLVGSREGFEAKWLARHEFSYELLDVSGWTGHTTRERVNALIKFFRATKQAQAFLKQFDADLVVGCGGYVSLPTAVAAVLSRIPLVLMEQNARPGLANRIMGRFAHAICVGFEPAAAFFPRSKVWVTGNPVRFKPQRQSNEEESRQRPFRLLILGGSSGAHRLNVAVMAMFEKITDYVRDFSIVHQTGAADEQLVKEHYARLGLNARVSAFLDEIAGELAAADLIISRAGAMAVSEIALMGKPAIFVPYPFHRDRQQELNARIVEQKGGAVILRDDQQLPEMLARELTALAGDRQRLVEMGKRAQSVARPDAACAIARICADIVSRWRLAA